MRYVLMTLLCVLVVVGMATCMGTVSSYTNDHVVEKVPSPVERTAPAMWD